MKTVEQEAEIVAQAIKIMKNKEKMKSVNNYIANNKDKVEKWQS